MSDPWFSLKRNLFFGYFFVGCHLIKERINFPKEKCTRGISVRILFDYVRPVNGFKLFIKFTLLKMRQFLRENFGFFSVETSKSPAISRILNCRRWSEMEDVMLPPLEQQVRSLVKMLSIRVAELFVRREGCNIKGLNP